METAAPNSLIALKSDAILHFLGPSDGSPGTFIRILGGVGYRYAYGFWYGRTVCIQQQLCVWAAAAAAAERSPWTRTCQADSAALKVNVVLALSG